MVPQFFGQQIDVITSGDVKVPVAFHLGDHDYVVAEIVETWQDYGFGKTRYVTKGGGSAITATTTELRQQKAKSSKSITTAVRS